MIEFKPRVFVLPAVAIAVLALLHAPADGGRSSQDQCGPALQIADPGLRASFAAVTRGQSAIARQVCAMHANTLR